MHVDRGRQAIASRAKANDARNLHDAGLKNTTPTLPEASWVSRHRSAARAALKRGFLNLAGIERTLDEPFFLHLADRVLEELVGLLDLGLDRADQAGRVENHQRFGRIGLADDHAMRRRPFAETRAELHYFPADRLVKALNHFVFSLNREAAGTSGDRVGTVCDACAVTLSFVRRHGARFTSADCCAAHARRRC